MVDDPGEKYAAAFVKKILPHDISRSERSKFEPWIIECFYAAKAVSLEPAPLAPLVLELLQIKSLDRPPRSFEAEELIDCVVDVFYQTNRPIPPALQRNANGGGNCEWVRNAIQHGVEQKWIAQAGGVLSLKISDEEIRKLSEPARSAGREEQRKKNGLPTIYYFELDEKNAILWDEHGSGEKRVVLQRGLLTTLLCYVCEGQPVTNSPTPEEVYRRVCRKLPSSKESAGAMVRRQFSKIRAAAKCQVPESYLGALSCLRTAGEVIAGGRRLRFALISKAPSEGTPVPSDTGQPKNKEKAGTSAPPSRGKSRK